ncbi:hypothetical protein EWM64_g5347 [Hericium alpestre]|uniref:Uncharacterized protein n=1 Tax=Hericium alpestre TaxID=135208 RepID=A0A4Y9ZUU7_9AGAM|nr:hypothetical protein EWM64_g5347 [Hericium alpestre]
MPKHLASKPYSGESRVRKPLIKPFTPKLRAQHYDTCSRRYKTLQPLDQLPPHLLIYPKKPRRNTPLFHFGVGVDFRQLYDYAFQHRLVPEDYRDNSRLNLEILQATVKHLDIISGANLYLEPIVHGKYGWIVARYSNYTWYHEEAKDWQEQMVMDLIKKELNVDDKPRWHPSVAP